MTENEFAVLMLDVGPWPAGAEQSADKALAHAAGYGLAEKICVDETTGEEWWRITDLGRASLECIGETDRERFAFAVNLAPRPPWLVADERVLAALAAQ